MRDNGFIKLDRKILNWRWYNDVNTFRVFVHLLLTANYTDGEYMTHQIKRGQVVTGRKKLSDQLKMTEREVRTALTHLKSTNEVTIETHSKFSIITINNYEKYQQVTNKTTSKRPASDQQVTNKRPQYKKEKNNKNNKKERMYKQSDDLIDDENLSECKKIKSMGGSLGKGVVMLSEEQDDYLLTNLSFDEYNKYVSIVADQELKGNHYTNKTHFQAILDMVEHDRKVGKLK